MFNKRFYLYFILHVNYKIHGEREYKSEKQQLNYFCVLQKYLNTSIELRSNSRAFSKILNARSNKTRWQNVLFYLKGNFLLDNIVCLEF